MNDNSTYLHFIIMSPDSYFYFIFVSRAYSTTPQNNLMILGRIIEEVSTEYHVQE